MDTPDDLLSRKEAAERFGVTEATLRAWEASGRLPVIRLLTGHHRYRVSDVESLVARTAALLREAESPPADDGANEEEARGLTRLDQRRAALEILHAVDVAGGEVEMGLATLGPFARRLVEGVAEHVATIDEQIATASTRWSIERMPVVDRNVLRLAVYELLYTDTPSGPIVDQAVTLAKLLSTPGSGRFVNGILARIARDSRGD